MTIRIISVPKPSNLYDRLLGVAAELNQTKYVTHTPLHIDAYFHLGAFTGNTCVGFLYVYVHTIGKEEQRPPIYNAQKIALIEGYAEAFGVLPSFRRQSIGQQLQEEAIAICKAHGCYQIRSRSPISSVENYALKLKMGYAIHPSSENDSYYFIKTLL